MLSFKDFSSSIIIEQYMAQKSPETFELTPHEQEEYDELHSMLSQYFQRKKIPEKVMQVMMRNAMGSDDLQENVHKELKKALEGTTVSDMVKGALARHADPIRGYGKEIGAPLSYDQAIKVSRKAAQDYLALSEDDRISRAQAAADRYGYVAYNETPESRRGKSRRNVGEMDVAKRLAGYGSNRKVETNTDNPLALYKGRSILASLGFGSQSAAYLHAHDQKASQTNSVVTCANASNGCAGAREFVRRGKLVKRGAPCLTQQGAYRFSKVKAKQDVQAHLRRSEASLRDYATLATHLMVNAARTAKEKGKAIAVRKQVSDQQGKPIGVLLDEISRAHPELADHIADYGYNKSFREVLEDARKRKSGEGIPAHTVFSHGGPAYHVDETGQHKLNGESLDNLRDLRDAQEIVRQEGLHVNTYAVVGGSDGDGQPHLQPKSSTPAGRKAAFMSRDNSIKKIRYWDLHHSGELQPGEPESHHDEATQSGHITIRQKDATGAVKKYKVRYHDQKVNPGATSTGHISYDQRHDGRFADAEYEPSPTGGHTLVSAPTSSTPHDLAQAAHQDSLISQIEVHHDPDGSKFRHSEPGMYHDAHPDGMQKAGFAYEPKRKNRYSSPEPTKINLLQGRNRGQ